MKFHEFGDKAKPPIMLIHGGGNSWWNYLRQAHVLSQNYHVILPALDGHGEEYAANYISTEDSAEKLIQYIDEHCEGHLFFLCGVSLGGQIVIEMLSRRQDITKKAVIDGSICYPRPAMAKLCILTVRLFSSLMFSKTACKLQLGLLRLSPKMKFPKELEQLYLQDMPLFKMETLYTIYQTYMMDYHIRDSIRQTQAQIMYWYGSKEMKCVKKSAIMLQKLVPSCQIYEAKGYNHGYLAIYLPDEWLQLVIPFLNN